MMAYNINIKSICSIQKLFISKVLKEYTGYIYK